MLAGLKCRCGTHMAMLRAVRRAADARLKREESA
jgi:aerobic-type carbon monoxide dehydrogenase small subunit (CoxS/CutS family)